MKYYITGRLVTEKQFAKDLPSVSELPSFKRGFIPNTRGFSGHISGYTVENGVVNV